MHPKLREYFGFVFKCWEVTSGLKPHHSYSRGQHNGMGSLLSEGNCLSVHNINPCTVARASIVLMGLLALAKEAVLYHWRSADNSYSKSQYSSGYYIHQCPMAWLLWHM